MMTGLMELIVYKACLCDCSLDCETQLSQVASSGRIT